MDLSNNELEGYLRSIFTGIEIVDIAGIDLLFRSPTNNIKIIASNLYNKAFKRACTDGLLPRDDLEKLIDTRGILSDKDKDALSKLEAKLSAQKVVLAKTFKVKANQDRLKKIIKDLRDEINIIRYKKLSKLMLCAEARADEVRCDFYCQKCTYLVLEDKLYWETYDTYSNDLDLTFKQEVLDSFSVFLAGIPTEIIRYIARSNLWRVRYVTSLKTSEALFGIPTSEYTDNMLNLVFWSNYYQNIYEMMPDDRPSDSIIEDDEALDTYMNSYYDERENENKARKHSKSFGRGKLSAFDSEEVIVTMSNELYEDIKYDKPREAQRVKDKDLLKKRTKRSR